MSVPDSPRRRLTDSKDDGERWERFLAPAPWMKIPSGFVCANATNCETRGKKIKAQETAIAALRSENAKLRRALDEADLLADVAGLELDGGGHRVLEE